MTYLQKMPSRPGTANNAETSIRPSLAAAAPPALAAAQASTAFAMSLTIALSYLSGRPNCATASAVAVIPKPVHS